MRWDTKYNELFIGHVALHDSVEEKYMRYNLGSQQVARRRESPNNLTRCQ